MTPDHADRSRLVEVAVRYATHGWPVVALHTPGSDGCSCAARACGSPGKHPRTRRGLHDATTDPDRVRGWWTRWPEANIGVATGSVSGLLVVDVDLPDGPASLTRLESAHARLPATCEQRTGSGGRQLLYAHPGGRVGNRTGLETGIDVRGDGGYIVVPPSRHASGNHYQWTAHRPPARPPDWLLALMDRTRTRDLPATLPEPPSSGTRAQRYASAALGRELDRLAGAVEGTRNDTLNRAAFNLGQLTAAGLLDPDEITDRLEQVATRIGLGQVETRRTIASGLAAGTRQPRSRPAPQPSPPSRSDPSARSTPVPVRRIGPRRR